VIGAVLPRQPRFGAYHPMPTRYPANPPSAAKTPTPMTFRPGLYRTHDSSLTGQNNLLSPLVAATAPTVAPATIPTEYGVPQEPITGLRRRVHGLCEVGSRAGEAARFGRRPLDARVHRLPESSQSGRPRCPLDNVREPVRRLIRRSGPRRQQTEQANQDPIRSHSYLVHIRRKPAPYAERDSRLYRIAMPTTEIVTPSALEPAAKAPSTIADSRRPAGTRRNAIPGVIPDKMSARQTQSSCGRLRMKREGAAPGAAEHIPPLPTLLLEPCQHYPSRPAAGLRPVRDLQSSPERQLVQGAQRPLRVLPLPAAVSRREREQSGAGRRVRRRTRTAAAHGRLHAPGHGPDPVRVGAASGRGQETAPRSKTSASRRPSKNWIDSTRRSCSRSRSTARATNATATGCARR